MDITRAQVLAFRHHVQGLGAGDGPVTADGPILDLGVQDSGPPGAARWALALRGIEVPDADLAYAWTLRGAPHAYRRADIAAVAAATVPYDEADAAKRIFDAAKPLREAGIAITDALAAVADAYRDVVRQPMVKGEVSTALTERLPDPYRRNCRPCGTIHLYEQPFRLAALPAGLELTPGTAPPVLRPIAGWQGPAPDVPPRLDPIRAVVHVFGPTTPKLVAGYLDAPIRTVKARWPADVVPVTLDGTTRDVLADDLDVLLDPPAPRGVRLLAPFDPHLQARDRELLLPDVTARKDLWRVLGRPGAILLDGHIVGSWRPRLRGDWLQVQIERHDGGGTADLDGAAERLAAARGARFAGYAAT